MKSVCVDIRAHKLLPRPWAVVLPVERLVRDRVRRQIWNVRLPIYFDLDELVRDE